MLAVHIALYALLGACFIFSIVELGLCAYIASAWSDTRNVGSYTPYAGDVYKNIHIDTPGILIFLIFSACWSTLVAVVAAILPWFYTRKGFVTAKLNDVLGIVFAILYFVTWVLWLACFADIASMFDGFTSYNNYRDAVLAFAVLLWYVSHIREINIKSNPAVLSKAPFLRSLPSIDPGALRCGLFRLGGLSVVAQDSDSRCT